MRLRKLTSFCREFLALALIKASRKITWNGEAWEYLETAERLICEDQEWKYNGPVWDHPKDNT